MLCVSDAAPVGGSTQPPQNCPPAGTSSPPLIAADVLPPGGDTEEEDGMTHMQQVSAMLERKLCFAQFNKKKQLKTFSLYFNSHFYRYINFALFLDFNTQ